MSPGDPRPRSAQPSRPALRYAAGLVFAHLLTAAEVVGVLVSLSRQTIVGTQALLNHTNLVALIVVMVVSTAVTAYGAHLNIAPSLRWFAAGARPNIAQRRAAINIVRRQSFLLMAVWLGAGIVFLAVNRDHGLALTVLLAVSVLFGGTATVSSSLLFTQRIIRPIVAAANRQFESRVTAPGVTARLLLMWTLTTALPSVTIVILVLCRANGWFIPTTASIDIPVILLSLVAVFLGLRSLILVSLSISDPLRDIVDAMALVEQGRIDQQVDVYEQSEIGRLQSGFNRMVTGLQERDRLRDLFGRHVGDAVARVAFESLDAEKALTGEVREVAVLFIDVTGSTELAMNHGPRELAEVLNEFFRLVVAAVDEHHGLINKFQGDAALAVFGAPMAAEHAAADALATARRLGGTVAQLALDFGVGVSAGPVFAGNIGSENRYEYTVIGDPVNEAARLADVAKALPERIAASGAALARAEDEAGHWVGHGSVTLRGRSEPTYLHVPR